MKNWFVGAGVRRLASDTNRIRASRRLLQWRRLFAAEMHGLFKRSFPEVGFCPGAPNLDLGDIVDVIRNGDALVELVALESGTFDRQFLQEVGVSLGVH